MSRYNRSCLDSNYDTAKDTGYVTAAISQSRAPIQFGQGFRFRRVEGRNGNRLVCDRHVAGFGLIVRSEGLSREVLELDGRVGASWVGVIVVAGRSFLSGFFDKLANYHGIGLESF